MNEKIYCTSCGAENETSAHFCVSCGAKLEPVVQEPDTNVNETVETVTGDVVDQDSVNADQNDYQNTYSQDTYTQTTQSTQTYYSVPEEPKKGGGYIGVAIASLICGILALICCPVACCGACCGGFNILLAIAAIALGIIALVKAFDGKGMAIAGLICGGIALIGMLFALAVPRSFAKGITTGILGEEYMDELQDIFDESGLGYDF